ncbi:MAG TPA: hypothetical protein VJ276_08715 [Thermoanaerobaculia bacterium]|nr:hypothetical protein [Thermoanaerobaculia bacterium]
MAKTIEIPEVHEVLYARLAWRAEAAGLSLSDYVLRELRNSLPLVMDQAEWGAVAPRLPPLYTSSDSADIIRTLRDADDPRDLG